MRQLDELVAELFAGDPSTEAPTIGIELELLPLRRTGGPGESGASMAPIAGTAAALAGLPYLAFEPGGQVELNPPPATTARRAIARMEALRAEVERRLAGLGIDVLAAGLDPWVDVADVPLQLTSDRYRAMDAHYAAVGTEGRRFMRQTASTQIGVGLRPGDAGRQQWLAANLIAPLLAAAFANGPLRQGRAVGHNGARTAIVLGADPARHRLRWVDVDPVDAYTAFAAGARPIGPAFAGASNAAAHLTTLFPPVRPRGAYLELRSIDALGADDLTTAVTLVAAVLASPAAVSAVLDRLPVTDGADRARWSAAAGPGIRCPALAAEVATVVDIAATSAAAASAPDGDLPAGYLPLDAGERLAALRDRVDQGRAPGDDLLRRMAASTGTSTSPRPRRSSPGTAGSWTGAASNC